MCDYKDCKASAAYNVADARGEFVGCYRVCKEHAAAIAASDSRCPIWGMTGIDHQAAIVPTLPATVKRADLFGLRPSKLSAEAVADIRASTESMRVLGLRYGVNATAIFYVKHQVTHV